MSLQDDLRKFADSIGAAGSNAPDEYPEWSSWNYAAHKADLKELWAGIRPQLERDLQQVEFVDGKLEEMFAAFDAGEKERGRKAAWALYKADLAKLR
jgi:hypothetical protein